VRRIYAKRQNANKAYITRPCGQFRFRHRGWKEISAGRDLAHFGATQPADQPSTGRIGQTASSL
jgi:hypothetical protein